MLKLFDTDFRATKFFYMKKKKKKNKEIPSFKDLFFYNDKNEQREGK